MGENKYNLEVGKRIKAARKIQKITLKSLGNSVGLSESTTKRYEDGQIKGVDINIIKKFAAALDVSLAWLMGCEEAKSKPVHLTTADVLKIGRRIDEARADRDISKKELAERVNVSPATITRYIKGQFADPKIPVLTAIAHSLNVNPAWICLRSEEKNVPEAATTTAPDPAENDEETAALKKYRRLSPEGRQYIQDQLDFRLGIEAKKAGRS